MEQGIFKVIKVPTAPAAWGSRQVALGGINYKMVWRFNDRDNRWQFDLYQNETLVIGGVKVVENTPLLATYRLEAFNHGILICLRTVNTTEPVGRYNLGIGKDYELIYLTNQEVLELQE